MFISVEPVLLPSELELLCKRNSYTVTSATDRSMRVGCRAVAVFADASQRESGTGQQCDSQLPSGRSSATSTAVVSAGRRGPVRRTA